ncbi:MAG: hypothetical protein JST91_00745 [Actinobacteria bacterium]|nr:hypothetical protein [Actinomycetota bacterium]
MDIAVRSYLTAGVAAVGATALIASPLAPAPPDIAVRADQVSVVFAEYTPTALSAALLGLPTPVEIRDAIGNLTLGGLGAVNAALAGSAAVAEIGALAFSDTAASLALTGQTINAALVVGFLNAIGFPLPAAATAGAAGAAFVDPIIIRDAIGNLTLGFLGAVNATLGGLADVAEIGALAFSDIAASLALTGQTVATALTVGFLNAIGFPLPGPGTASVQDAAFVAPTAVRDFVGNLTLGFLGAVTSGLGGLADVADIGATAFSDISASLALTGQTVATALTVGFLNAIGFPLPQAEARTVATAAAALIGPTDIRDAVGNLTLGGLGAVNAGLAGLADVADIGALAFSDTAASLALTGQTVAGSLTAGFLNAIGFPLPEADAGSATVAAVAAALVSPTDIRNAVGNLTLGGLGAVNATLAGAADVADIGALAFSDTAASLALTGQTVAGSLTAGFLNAIGFPLPDAESEAERSGPASVPQVRSLVSVSLPGTGSGAAGAPSVTAVADASIGGGGSAGGGASSISAGAEKTEPGGSGSAPGNTPPAPATGPDTTDAGATDGTAGDSAAPGSRQDRKTLRDLKKLDRTTARSEQRAERGTGPAGTRAERTTTRKAQAEERRQQRTTQKAGNRAGTGAGSASGGNAGGGASDSGDSGGGDE